MTKRCTMRMLSLLGLALAVLVFAPSAAAEEVVVNRKPVAMSRNEKSAKRFEVTDLIAEKRYEEAWAGCELIFRASRYQPAWMSDMLILMSRIAMRDPDLRNNGRRRLQILLAWFPDLVAVGERPEEKPYRARIHCPYLTKVHAVLARLAASVGEFVRASELLGRAYDFAMEADFSVPKERSERVMRLKKGWRRRLLRGLIRDLVAFGEPAKAASLLGKQWTFLHDGTWKSPDSVKGLAFVRVAEMLEEQENVGIAATFLKRAKRHLEAAKDMTGSEAEAVQEALAVAEEKLRWVGKWIGVKRVRRTYLDSKVLAQTFQKLADRYSNALSRGDAEAALKLVCSPDKGGEDFVPRSISEFRKRGIASVRYSDLRIGPVAEGDTTVGTQQCTFTITYKDGREKSWPDHLRFARKGDQWKIVVRAWPEGEEDEDK